MKCPEVCFFSFAVLALCSSVLSPWGYPLSCYFCLSVSRTKLLFMLFVIPGVFHGQGITRRKKMKIFLIGFKWFLDFRWVYISVILLLHIAYCSLYYIISVGGLRFYLIACKCSHSTISKTWSTTQGFSWFKLCSATLLFIALTWQVINNPSIVLIKLCPPALEFIVMILQVYNTSSYHTLYCLSCKM